MYFVFGCPLFESLDKYDISNINDCNCYVVNSD